MRRKEKVEKLVKGWFAKTVDYEWEQLRKNADCHMFRVDANFKAEKS